MQGPARCSRSLGTPAGLVAGQLLDEMGMLGEQPTLQSVPLLARHRRDVQRVGRLLVHGLLQLAAIHELHVGDGYRSSFASVLVLKPAAQRGEHRREVVVESRRCASRIRDPRVARVRGGTGS